MLTQTRVLDACASAPLPKFLGRQDHELVPLVLGLGAAGCGPTSIALRRTTSSVRRACGCRRLRSCGRAGNLKAGELRAIRDQHAANCNHRKACNIDKPNLGRHPWNQRQHRHNRQTHYRLCQTAHSVVGKANRIVCGDRSAPLKSAQRRRKDTCRRMSGWTKKA